MALVRMVILEKVWGMTWLTELAGGLDVSNERNGRRRDQGFNLSMVDVYVVY